MSKYRLGVIFGGRSVEHEVSIVTGYQSIEAVHRDRYDVTPVYISRDNIWYIGEHLSAISFFRQDQPPLNLLTRVFPCPDPSRGKLILIEAEGGLFKKRKEITLDVILPTTHGTFVEDGCLQGLFEMAGVPYAGSDPRGSAVGMDKELTKAVLAAAGLPHLAYEIVTSEHLEQFRNKKLEIGSFGYPVIVKPASLGSSVAVSQAADRKSLETALDLALRFCERALVEPAVVDATEINCSVLDGDPPLASMLEQPVKPGSVLTFDEKYKSGGGKKGGDKLGGKGQGMVGQHRLIPAPLDDEMTTKIKDLAVKTFQAVGAGGVARVDFLIAKTGEVYVNELNNIPGSLSYYLWEPVGKSFGDLIDRMIDRAFEVNKRRNRTTFSFEANLLAGR